MKSQEKQIKSYLETGRPLTPIDALKKFGCFRLGARIYNLRRQGIDIKSKMIAVNKGKHVAMYYMEQ